jgi:hypothetical protein
MSAIEIIIRIYNIKGHRTKKGLWSENPLVVLLIFLASINGGYLEK